MTATREDLQELIERMKLYNDWRRGSDDIEQPEPKQLGLDIDVTIKVLEDRLNQVDYKSLAEEQNETLLLCKKDYEGIIRVCKQYGFEKTFKDCGESIEYIDKINAKYEQAIKGERDGR